MQKDFICLENISLPMLSIIYDVPAIDEEHVFTRQYRVPLVHKEKLLKRTSKLKKNKIINSSQSLLFDTSWDGAQEKGFLR